ncbi:hypothetical protein WA026_003419 [Henosepilachna vigintioctopunctata]|uniref:Uncharacterized protein n=1 Tax=Henosepilachna vigintioctopunctata TaxID=420089 RepID=A0AAW1TPJ2_9CUCU
MEHIIIFFCLIVTVMLSINGEESFSFHEFRGPVSGEAQKVITADQHVDYIARPDYSYAYGVQDLPNGNTHVHKESRNGDVVRGEYRVLQADGFVRIVRYIADAENGFQATVEYEPNQTQ